MRVLVAEDHRELAATLAVGLRREGMAVDVVFDGQAALGHTERENYDVIVLDRDLPKLDGDDVCRTLVSRGSRARVLMLTAASTIESRVDGLSLGADDYLPKPFAFAELVARIRALARRNQPALPPTLVKGDIRLDTAAASCKPSRPPARAQPQGGCRPRAAARRRRRHRLHPGAPPPSLGRVHRARSRTSSRSR